MARNNGSNGSPTKPTFPSAKTEGYVDVDRLTNADRLEAVISRRNYDGAYTFAISRKYDQHGEEKSTAFCPEYLIKSYMDLLSRVGKRIAELRDASVTTDAKGA